MLTVHPLIFSNTNCFIILLLRRHLSQAALGSIWLGESRPLAAIATFMAPFFL